AAAEPAADPDPVAPSAARCGRTGGLGRSDGSEVDRPDGCRDRNARPVDRRLLGARGAAGAGPTGARRTTSEHARAGRPGLERGCDRSEGFGARMTAVPAARDWR